MSKINWKPYISTRSHGAVQSIPQVTITKNNGRISLNSAACELNPNIYSYKFVEIYCGSIDGILKKIRLQFTNKKSSISIPVTRKKYKGNFINGAFIHSKPLTDEIFKTYPNLTDTCYFCVDLQIIDESICLSFDFTESLIN